MKQIIYLGGKKARNYTAPHEETDVIGDCDWKEGEVKTEGVDYFITYIRTEVKNIIPNYHTHIPNVPIPKKQEGESAATPPDVEQMAKEVLYRRMAEANQNRENIIALATFKQFYDSPFMKEDWAWIKAALVEMYQAGQSAVQDATPENSLRKVAEPISQDATPQEWEQIYKQHHGGLSDWKFNYWSRNIPFGKAATAYVSTLRSELSAAQAQAKALSAIKKGLETSLTEALSSLAAAQEENKKLRETVINGLRDIKRAAQVNIDEDDIFNAAG